MSIQRDIPQALLHQWVQQGIHKGFLSDLVPTLDGRLSVADMARVLNVDASHITHCLNTAKTSWTVLYDLVLTNHSIDTLITQLKNTLDEVGWVSVVVQAQLLSLPYAFLQTTLQERLLCHKEYLKYPALPDMLLSQSYATDSMEKIQTALIGLTEPLSMATLQMRLGLQESLFYVMLDSMKKQDLPPGQFHGRREKALFEPYVYRDRQVALIHSLLDAGNYIEYDTVQQHYPYANPMELLKRHCVDIHFLETCAVTKALVKSLEKDIYQVLNANHWLDVYEWGPSSLSPKDAVGLLDITMSLFPGATKPLYTKRSDPFSDPSKTENRIVPLESRFVTTLCYLQDIVQNTTPFLKKIVSLKIQGQKKLHSAKGKMRREEKIVLPCDQISEYWVQQGLPTAFAGTVAVALKRPMSEVYQKALHTVYLPPAMSVDEKWVEALKEKEQEHLRTLGWAIVRSSQAIKLFKEQGAQKSLEKYIVKVLCLEFLYHLLVLHSLSEVYTIAEIVEKIGVSQKDLESLVRLKEDEEKIAIQSMLENINNSDINSLYQTIAIGKHVDAFLTYFETLSFWPQSQIEGAMQEAQEKKSALLLSQLESTPLSEAASPSILHITCLAYFQSLFPHPLYVSGKYVPYIIRQCTPLLEAEDRGEEARLLEIAHSMIMGYVRSKQPIDLSLLEQVKMEGQNLLKIIK
ncbi:hypothetical protein BDF14DRAFT_1879412 [Spinellus fusiger]|nr:hypothetical protein BDF14DRAFT_1879412 [Spinellus fusiger]